MLPELVIFDFAGTTLREDGAVLAAYRRALTAHGIEFEEVDLAARRGAAKRAVFRELSRRTRDAQEAEVAAEQALASFEEALREEYSLGVVAPIEGAEGVVRWLSERAVKVALASGFDRRLVDLLVRRLGWERLFDCVLAAEDVSAGRPAPYLIFRAMMDLAVERVARVAVVGDTPLDLQAGTNARAGWVIGVLSGAHGLQTLAAAPHTHILPSVASLPELFSESGPS